MLEIISFRLRFLYCNVITWSDLEGIEAYRSDSIVFKQPTFWKDLSSNFRILRTELIIVSYIRGCYYTNWAQYRLESNGAFLPEDIASNLCTHILYAFASATAEGTAIPTEWNDEAIRSRPGLYARVVNLKNINPKLKVLLAFDGGALGSKAFSIIVQSIEKRKNFTKSTIAFVRKHKFDGIVLHWNEMGKEYEHANFIKEIKEAFMKESQFSSNEQLVLTIAGSAQKDSIDASYQVDFLAKNIDLLFLLAYDFHNGLEQTTDLPSKLYSSQKDAVDNVVSNFQKFSSIQSIFTAL
ncbi:unnamed protein product [Thelazia callipaeda]|uniref:Chitinase-3-like protein 1 n=1 Tax=Thelazia callipaeda TaxID=103827 RepID=A0A0N5CPK4_THECL|nr:unnamed protein product [Thelazia callipaeda]